MSCQIRLHCIVVITQCMILLGICGVLAACGQKGALYLPDSTSAGVTPRKAEVSRTAPAVLATPPSSAFLSNLP